MPVKLYIFTISHYCEKARWALDYLNIDYQLIALAPGEHAQQAKRMGLTATSVPFLDDGQQVIQGSARIIDWAEQFDKQREPKDTPLPLTSCDECLAIEERLDRVLGVHTRRWFYSEALVEFPQSVLPIFTKDLSLLKSLKLRLIWPRVRQFMIDKMDLGYEQGLESQAIVAGEVDWLDGLLGSGQQYLAGESFSRADLAAASFLMPFLSLKNSPQSDYMILPPRMENVMQAWLNRPSIKLVEHLYNKYR